MRTIPRVHAHNARIAGPAALAAAALLLTGAAAAPATEEAAATAPAAHGLPSEREIRDQFRLWDAALDTGDPEVVADRYAPDGVLVPTLSNDIRTDRASIVDYFTEFLARQPEAGILESHVNVLDHDSAIDTGAYHFDLVDEQGQPYWVDGRYTFVYEKDHSTGEWLIVNHHSSVNPET